MLGMLKWVPAVCFSSSDLNQAFSKDYSAWTVLSMCHQSGLQ